MGNPTYLITLLGLFVFSTYLIKKHKLKLFRTTKHALLYFSLIFLTGLVWDYFSVSQNIWIFPENGTSGLRVGLLPVEEFLFFFMAPYFGLTVYKFLEAKIR